MGEFRIDFLDGGDHQIGLSKFIVAVDEGAAMFVASRLPVPQGAVYWQITDVDLLPVEK
jgi:hypothetical protein